MNFCCSLAFSSQAPALREPAEACAALTADAASLFGSWQGGCAGFFPAVFVSCGAAFSGGYTLLSQEAASAFKGSASPLALALCCGLQGRLPQPSVSVGERVLCSQTVLGIGVIAGLG